MTARCACVSSAHGHGAACAFRSEYECFVCGHAMCWDCWRQRNLVPVLLPEGRYAHACSRACHYALAVQNTGGYAAHLRGELAVSEAYICQLCGKPSTTGFEHRECMDRENAMADDPERYFGGQR